MFIKRAEAVVLDFPQIDSSVNKLQFKDEQNEIVEFDYDPENFVYFRCRAITADVPNTNFDYFPAEEVKKAYKTFIGIGLYKDHDADSVEKAIGKVLWAEYIEDGKYVECYAAIDKNLAPDLAYRVKMGIVNSVSMGCTVQRAECSYCGNVATNVDELCVHVIPGIGSKGKYIDGKLVYEINYGLNFYDLSLVTNPADRTARIFEVVAARKLPESTKLYNVLVNKDKIYSFINKIKFEDFSENVKRLINDYINFYKPNILAFYEEQVKGKLYEDLSEGEKVLVERYAKEEDRIIKKFNGLSPEEKEKFQTWLLISGFDSKPLFKPLMDRSEFDFLKDFNISIDKDVAVGKQEMSILQEIESHGEIPGLALFLHNRTKFDEIVSKIKASVSERVQYLIDNYVTMLERYKELKEKAKAQKWISVDEIKNLLTQLYRVYSQLLVEYKGKFKELLEEEKEFIHDNFSTMRDKFSEIGIIHPPAIRLYEKATDVEPTGKISADTLINVIINDHLARHLYSVNIDTVSPEVLKQIVRDFLDFHANRLKDRIVPVDRNFTVSSILHHLGFSMIDPEGHIIDINYELTYKNKKVPFIVPFEFFKDKFVDRVSYSTVKNYADSVKLNNKKVMLLIEAIRESKFYDLINKNWITISGINTISDKPIADKIDAYINSLQGKDEEPIKITGIRIELSKFLENKKINLDDIKKEIEKIHEEEIKARREKFEEKMKEKVEEKWAELGIKPSNIKQIDTYFSPVITLNRHIGLFDTYDLYDFLNNYLEPVMKKEKDIWEIYNLYISKQIGKDIKNAELWKFLYDKRGELKIFPLTKENLNILIELVNKEIPAQKIVEIISKYGFDIEKIEGEVKKEIEEFEKKRDIEKQLEEIKKNEIPPSVPVTNVLGRQLDYIVSLLIRQFGIEGAIDEYIKMPKGTLYIASQMQGNLEERIQEAIKIQQMMKKYNLRFEDLNDSLLEIMKVEFEKPGFYRFIKKYYPDNLKAGRKDYIFDVSMEYDLYKNYPEEQWDKIREKEKELKEERKKLYEESEISNEKIIKKYNNIGSFEIEYVPGIDLKSSLFVARENNRSFKIAAYEILPWVVQEAILKGDENVISSHELVEKLRNKFSSLKEFKKWALRRKKKNIKAFNKYILTKTSSIQMEETTMPEEIKKNIEPSSEKLQEFVNALDELSKILESRKKTAATIEKIKAPIDGESKPSSAPEPKADKEVVEVKQRDGKIAKGIDVNWSFNPKEVLPTPKPEKPVENLPSTASMEPKEVEKEALDVKVDRTSEKKVKDYYQKLGPGATGQPPLSMDVKSALEKEILLLKTALEKERAEKEALLQKEKSREKAEKIIKLISDLSNKGLVESGKEEEVASVIADYFQDDKSLEGLKAIFALLSFSKPKAEKEVKPKVETEEKVEKKASRLPQVLIEGGLSNPSDEDELVKWLSENWNK